jgi:hypothetical protein
MMGYIIEELKYNAKIFQKTGMVSNFDVGVIKTDRAISEELKHALNKAVRPLEDVTEKDYHPGSDGKVVDLVHPSLFPVIYGRSRILKDEVIGLNECLARSGNGEVLRMLPEYGARIPGYPQFGFAISHTLQRVSPFSRKFQWLPCDVEFKDADECRIVSYINNLHPGERNLYQVIEKILTRTVPLWNQSLTAVERREPDRITYDKVEYLPSSEPEPRAENESDWDDEDFLQRFEEWEASQQVKLPEPGEFAPPSLNKVEIDLRKQYHDRGLQVIVKLANIELTPEKPEYEGGSWHIEGQLASSAIFFCNVTPLTCAE